ncbi:translocation/assembly module TamB domain-containing protein [Natronospora cellulosivora (SeqCode)]
MKYKSLFFIALIMFAIISFSFLYRSASLVTGIGDELIAYLEKNYQVEIDVEEANIWPINLLRLEEVEIRSEDDQFSLFIPEFEIYYDVFNIFAGSGISPNIIQQVHLSKPQLNIQVTNDSIHGVDLGENGINGLEDFNPAGFMSEIYSFIPFDIAIEEGEFNFSNERITSTLPNMNLLFKADNNKQMQIQLDTAINADKFKWQDIELKDFELDSLKTVVFLNNDDWNIYVESSQIEMSAIDLINKFTSELTDIGLDSMEGYIYPRLWIKGTGLEVENYDLSIDLKDIRFALSGNDEHYNNHLENLPVDLNGLVKGFSFEKINGEIIYQSSKNTFSANEIEFYLDDSAFKLDAYYRILENNTGDIYARFRSTQLELSNLKYLYQDNINVSGRSAFDLTAKGPIDDIDINLDFSLLDAELNGIAIDNLVSRLRFYNNKVYLDHLNFLLDKKSQIELAGVYNNNDTKYSIELETRDLDLAILKEFNIDIQEEMFSQISARTSISASLAGKGFSLDKLNASASIEMDNTKFILAEKKELGDIELSEEINLSKISSDFYLADKVIMFQDLSFIDKWGEINMAGELAIDKPEFDIKLNTDSVHLSLLMSALAPTWQKNHQNQLISGDAKLSAGIQRGADGLSINADISVDEGFALGYRYNMLTANLAYQEDEFRLDGLSFDFQGIPIWAEANLRFINDEILTRANISSDSFEYGLMNNILIREGLIEEPLPFTGDIDLELSLDGLINKPKILVKLNSENTTLDYKDIKIPLDALNAVIEQKEEALLVNELFVHKGNSTLQVDGLWDFEEFDLQYALEDFPIQSIVREVIELDLDGLLNLSGAISGTFADLELSADINTYGLTYQYEDIGNLNGELLYSSDTISIRDLLWQYGDGVYKIQGDINDLLSKAYFDFIFLTEDANVDQIPIVQIPHANLFENYRFQVKADINGYLSDISSQLEFIVKNKLEEDEKIVLFGEIGEFIDLELKGENFAVDNILREFTGLSFDGKMNFDGYIQGDFADYTLYIDTNIEEAYLENIMAERIFGQIELKNASDFNMNQQILLSAERSLAFNSYFSIAEGAEGVKFSAESRNFPLEIISSYDSSWPDFSGDLSGEISFTGGLEQPSLVGKVSLNDVGLDMDLPDRLSKINGDLLFNGQEIQVPNINAMYGDGEFFIQGLIRPFRANDNLELRAVGEDLPFNYGSFDGYFDPDVRIIGPLDNPLLKGDILTHNLKVGMPIEWEEPKGTFSFELDLNLYPGENVSLKNNYLDIAVQEGMLNVLYYDKEVDIIGQLSSKQGRFEFYNNVFNLNEGTATFERSFYGDDALIPNISAEARTNVRGTIVEVRLRGKATNMDTTFTSSPALDPDEILLLLTQRGGLGEFMTGNWTGIVETELFRMLQNRFQLDFIGNIQEAFREALELDHLEVNTYDFGWSNEVAIYIGKYINNRLYLQYSDVFKSDFDNLWREDPGELSLIFYLNDEFTLQSNWMGRDRYSFSVETNIQF